MAAALHACEGQVFIDLQLLIYIHKYICLFFCVVGWMSGSKPAAYNLEVFGRWPEELARLIVELIQQAHTHIQQLHLCYYYYYYYYYYYVF